MHTLNRVLLGDYFGNSHYARLWGILGMASTPLGILGPVFAGSMYDHLQSYHTVILVFAIADVFAAIAYYNCRRPKAPARVVIPA